jgi:hypothetical protein
MIVVAILTIAPGRLDTFRDFERRAAVIMARHGGAIERAVFVPGAQEREVHVLHFPSPASFAAYRADAELVALASMRAEAIVATKILVGEDGPAYGRAGEE